MIDPKLFTVESLLLEMLSEHNEPHRKWLSNVKIIPDYMSSYPHKETRARCVVAYRDLFLRWSAGPIQGYFWDVYGNDFVRPEWALMAILRAPEPPSCEPDWKSEATEIVQSIRESVRFGHGAEVQDVIADVLADAAQLERLVAKHSMEK